MAIRCGRGPHTHETAEYVRLCYNGEEVQQNPITGPAEKVVSDERPATDKQVAFLLSLADQKLPADEAEAVREDARNGRWGRRSISAEIGRLKELPKRRTFIPSGEDGMQTLGGYQVDLPAAEDASPANQGWVSREQDRKRAESSREPQTDEPLEAGMYRLGKDVYKVQRNVVQGDGSRAYAKRLTAQSECRECGEHENFHDDGIHEFSPKWKFERVPGAIYKISPEMRMTLDEAKTFGKIYGTCCVCGRTLTNEISIEEGIGPVCGGRV